MELGINNKNAVVLASTKGLGLAIARNLYMEGCNVAICSRNDNHVRKTLDEFKALQQQSKVIGRAVDVADEQELDDFFDYVLDVFGNIDILVTNAGGPPSGKFTDFKDAEWYKAFDLNFMSVVRSVRKVLPGMKLKKSGRIIAVTSIAVKSPVQNLMLSNSVRAGVTGFIKSLSNELAPVNITVNSVCPGYIHTDRISQLVKEESSRTRETPEEVLRKWENTIPMQRMGSPEEFASLVAYLCSEKASYITGATYWMDGWRYPGLL